MNFKKLAKAWKLKFNEAKDVFERMNIAQHNSIDYAGIIDNNSSNKIYNHTGFWICYKDGWAYIIKDGFVTSLKYDEYFCSEIEIKFDKNKSFKEVLKEFKI